MESGIYKISSIDTGDFYIGSSINIKDRWIRHKKDLNKNRHHSIFLQMAWNKYGKSNFLFEVLQYCKKEECVMIEQLYIDSMKPCYNMSKSSSSRLGVKDSDETRQKKREGSIRAGNIPPRSTWELRKKSVYMLDDSKNILREFDSLAEACRFIGRDASFVTCISRACKLEVKSYNYYWKLK